MSEAKYTPGPWYLRERQPTADTKPGDYDHPDCPEIRIDGDPKEHYTVAVAIDDMGNQAINKANARLIAAGPEMEDALEAIAEALDAPRNRFSKLEPVMAQTSHLGRLASKYKVVPAEDTIHHAVLVARAVIAKART